MTLGIGKRNIDALEAERCIPTLGRHKSLAKEAVRGRIDGPGNAAARDQNLLVPEQLISGPIGEDAPVTNTTAAATRASAVFSMNSVDLPV
jgi:hypothetical protein